MQKLQRKFVDTFSFSYILCVQLELESLVPVKRCLETSFLSYANNVWKLACICCVALLILLIFLIQNSEVATTTHGVELWSSYPFH